MKKLKLISTFIGLFCSGVLFAQNEVDALRYSMINFGGTARYSAMSGAYGAVGADFSSISLNPAGIALYRKNEFTLSPSVYTGKTESTYNGKDITDSKYNFNISNFGLVYTFTGAEKETGWKSANFGFGVNRYNNFHNRISIEGDNNKNSILDLYLDGAQGYTPANLDPFGSMLAFDAGLIDTLNGNDISYSSVFYGGGMRQLKTIETRGAMQEMVFSVGGNYSDKFYIGGTFGFPFVRYVESTTYRETDITDTVANIKSFTINEDLSTTGSGFNFKLGLIYKPTDWVRIGAAVHTPTFFALHDEWSKNISAVYETGPKGSADSPNGLFDYELTTPMRAIGSVAFVIKGYGIISADYEFVDYSEARLRSKQYKYFDENNSIQEKYTAQHNIRLGAEAALGMISLRGGVAMYGNPYKSGVNDGARMFYSGGIGFLDNGYFLDLAYVYGSSSENYYLYDPALVNAASTKKTTHNVVLTMGFKF